MLVLSIMVSMKHIGRKFKKGGKAATTAGKVGVNVGKAMNAFRPGSGNNLVRGGRALRSSGRAVRAGQKGKAVKSAGFAAKAIRARYN